MEKNYYYAHFPPCMCGKYLSFNGLKRIIMLCYIAFMCTGSLFAQQTKLTVSYKNRTIPSVLDDLKARTGYNFFYLDGLIPENATVTVNVKNATLEDALNMVLVRNGYSYTINDRLVVITREEKRPPAQDAKLPPPAVVSGVVLDGNGDPVHGATVAVQGTSRGNITDKEGRFTLGVYPRDVLVFSYVGKKSVQVAYVGQQTISIKLEDDMVNIENVVVTGFYNRPKESYTGAATSISAEQLSMAGNHNILTAIRNIDPSFHITTDLVTGSDPNKLPEITVRGRSSLPNVGNLDNIKDIGEVHSSLVQANLPLFILDGFETTLQQVYDMDETRVANITILKDAAATAIYGTRASNGVIVITTKEPEAGRLRIGYSASMNIEVPDFSSYNLMNAREKLRYELLSGLYNGTNDYDHMLQMELYNKRVLEASRGVDTYWLKYPVRTGVGQEHNVTAEGGAENMRYSASLSYNDIKGVMKGSDRTAVNGSVSLQYSVKNFKFRNILSVSNSKSNNSPYGFFSEYASLNPYWTPYDEHGNIAKVLEDIQMTSGYGNMTSYHTNPLYNASISGKDCSESTSINNNFSAEWQVIRELSLRVRFGYGKNSNQTDKYVSPDHTKYNRVSPANEELYARRGTYDYSSGNGDSYDLDVTANYHGQFGKHSVYASGGLTLRESTGKSYFISAEGVNKPFLGMAQYYPENGHPGGGESVSRSAGLLLNGNYTYDNRYIVDLSFRYEGSSKFGSNKRFAPFWALGLGWNIKREAFMKDITWINAMKLRSSYGITGSLSFAPYQAEKMYSIAYGTNYHGSYIATLKGLGNPDLKWEQTRQFNVGLDLTLFGNVTLVLDAYHKLTTNTLADIGLPSSSGFPTYKSNMGEVENKGFDGNINFLVLSIPSKQISLRVGTSVAFNSNKIKKISNELEAMNNMIINASDKHTDPSRLYVVGQSLSTLYAVQSLGLDPNTGREVFLNKDGEATYIWRAADQIAVGNSDPKMNGSINCFFHYKSLTISAYMRYYWGGKTYNHTLASKVENVDNQLNNDRRVLYDRWQEPGDTALFKSISDNSTTHATSRFVMKDNFLGMSSLSAQYNLPQQWLNSLRISDVMLQLNVEEPFFFSSIKQERGTAYPFSRKFSMKIRVNF